MCDTANDSCDIAVCRARAACNIKPDWCRTWRYVHNRCRSNANAAKVGENIPAEYVTVDVHGVLHVAPEAVSHD
jgi:hypothetical protein